MAENLTDSVIMALLFGSPVPRAPVLPVAMLMMTHHVSYQSLLLCELHNSLYSLKRGNCSSVFCNAPPAMIHKRLSLPRHLRQNTRCTCLGVLVMIICVCCRSVTRDVASCAQNTECSSCHGSVPSCPDAATAQAAAKDSLQGKLAALCIPTELVSVCLKTLFRVLIL